MSAVIQISNLLMIVHSMKIEFHIASYVCMYNLALPQKLQPPKYSGYTV